MRATQRQEVAFKKVLKKYAATVNEEGLRTIQPEKVNLFKSSTPDEAEFTGSIADFIAFVEDEYEY